MNVFAWMIVRALVFGCVVTTAAWLLNISASGWRWGVMVFVIIITSDAVNAIWPGPTLKKESAR